MPTLELQTIIQAPVETCFDLSRSVDLHLLSTAGTGEKVAAGRTSGLLELNEDITWRAKHFGVWQNLTSRITEFDYPNRFISEMQRGAFRKLHHVHLFKKEGTGSRMTDVFTFEAPFGVLGKLMCYLVLTNYMKGFLLKRNELIKKTAEKPI